MSDTTTRVLGEVIAEVGSDPEAILEALHRRGYWLTENPWMRREREKREAAEARKREAEAQLAAAVPYAGAIRECQVSVLEPGRGVRFHRCGRRPIYVVRRTEPGVRETERASDGRIAVCRQHAGDPTSSRFVSHSKYERESANEPVEPEYQPGTVVR